MTTRTDKHEYGTNEIGCAVRSASGTWFRHDTYTSFSTGEQTIERRFSSGGFDISPLFTGEYDASCSSCFLNHSHTAGYHNKQVRNARRRERDQVLRDMGLTKVRGNLGGTYWE